MSEQFDLDYAAIKKQVVEELKKQRRLARGIFLGIHAGIFVLFSIMAFSMLSSGTNIKNMPTLPPAAEVGIIGALILLLTGWGTGLLFHFFATLNDFGVFDAASSRKLAARVISKQVLDDIATETGEDAEKRKRKGKPPSAPDDEAEVRLSAEGELIPVEEDAESEPKRMRGKPS